MGVEVNLFVRACWQVIGGAAGRLVILSVVLLFTSACQPISPTIQQLRVLNAGSEDIKNLAVLFPGPTSDAEAARIQFGDVPAGKTTDYRKAAGGVYRYAAFSYMLGDRVINQSVVDWVGENPMQGAKFTYQLELNTQNEPGGQILLIAVLVDEP